MAGRRVPPVAVTGEVAIMQVCCGLRACVCGRIASLFASPGGAALGMGGQEGRIYTSKESSGRHRVSGVASTIEAIKTQVPCTGAHVYATRSFQAEVGEPGEDQAKCVSCVSGVRVVHQALGYRVSST